MGKYLDRRIKKGKALMCKMTLLSASRVDDIVIASGIAPSSNGGDYLVTIMVRDGKPLRRACECPDEGALLEKRYWCKHAVALLLYWRATLELLALVNTLTGWEWVSEFGGGAWVYRPH